MVAVRSALELAISRSIIEAHEGKLWDLCNRTGGATPARGTIEDGFDDGPFNSHARRNAKGGRSPFDHRQMGSGCRSIRPSLKIGFEVPKYLL
jgi:hypothetical protein